MYKRVGIVLKELNSPHKIALLDEQHGRIDAIIKKPTCVGALLHYTIEQERGNFWYLSQLSISHLPFQLARDDILFWHHVLEISYFFVPIGSSTYSLFKLLQFLYTVDNNVRWCTQSKKLYLFKLLAAIGLYDRLPSLVPIGRVEYLLGMPVDEIVQEKLDEKNEQIVDEWLRTCIAEHPAIEQFNTVHFLINNGQI